VAHNLEQNGEPSSLHVGLAGPVLSGALEPYLRSGHTPVPAGLGGTPVWQLATSLLDAGAHVTVASLDASAPARVIACGQHLTLKFGCFRPRARDRMRDLMRTERCEIRRALESAGPDIVHAHWAYEYALGSLATGLPTLVTVHDWAPTILRLSPDAYRLGRLAMFGWCLAKAPHLTAVSPHIQVHVERLSRRPVAVIPNGLPDDSFLHQSAGLAPHEPVVVSVNNGFGRLKNVSALLEAFALVRRSLPASRLLLAGKDFGPEEDAHRWACQAGCADGVEFLGPLSREGVLALLRSASTLVHPALEESFGMTLIEAMSQRVPVVGGNRSGAVPWVLDHGRAGILTEVSDPRALATAMTALLTDESRRQHYAERGFRHAWTAFRQSIVTDRYLAEYELVLRSVGAIT
jgi:glycosyltransferase involved in cell wall biosynthesis